MASLDYEGQLLPLQPSREAQAEPLFSLSSALGNDSCGVEADAKYNDTDLCWGPLRRVDAYRIYLVSGLASAPQPRPARPPWGPGGREPPSLLAKLCPESRVCTAHTLADGSRAGRGWYHCHTSPIVSWPRGLCHRWFGQGVRAVPAPGV